MVIDSKSHNLLDQEPSINEQLIEEIQEPSDLTTVVLTDKARSLIEGLVGNKKWFKQMDDAAHFAMALAINRGVDIDGKLEQTKTTWGVDRFDKEGQIRLIVSALYPEAASTPIRQINCLIDKGTEIIDEFLKNDPSATLSDFLRFSIEEK